MTNIGDPGGMGRTCPPPPNFGSRTAYDDTSKCLLLHNKPTHTSRCRIFCVNITHRCTAHTAWHLHAIVIYSSNIKSTSILCIYEYNDKNCEFKTVKQYKVVYIF